MRQTPETSLEKNEVEYTKNEQELHCNDLNKQRFHSDQRKLGQNASYYDKRRCVEEHGGRI